MATVEFSYLDKLACVEREYRLRREKYPHWVTIHKISAQKAEKELALMDAIVKDYRKLAEQELLL